jgi:erythronate-4-phosphate dehydrogenase
MLILADENIPFARDAFGSLGDVRLISGRAMTAPAVRDAELLLVRSITRVDRALLEGSRVRFVATATIGTDHVDEAWLREAGIAFSAAPGSNANSVGEYMVCALLTLAARQGRPLAGRSIGIVGVGNVGTRVEAKCRALGMKALLNDPPLQRRTGDPKYRPLDELSGCDFITLHTPLEKGGPDPTWHLADARFISRMRPDAVLCNAGRGDVVDGAALLAALESRRVAGAVLDVWAGEPGIDPALLGRVDLATPHIAGYSYDGKVNGTEMIYRAACAHLKTAPRWDRAACMPAPEFPELALDAAGRPDEAVLREAALRLYPIHRDDEGLRRLAALPADKQGRYFDKLRKDYPVRREFHTTRLRLNGATQILVEKARGIGFATA